MQVKSNSQKKTREEKVVRLPTAVFSYACIEGQHCGAPEEDDPTRSHVFPSHASFHSGPSPHQSIDSSGDVEISRRSWQIIMLLTDSCTDINQVLSPQRDSSNSYTQTKRLS